MSLWYYEINITHPPINDLRGRVWPNGTLETQRLSGCLEESSSLPSSWKSRDCEDAWRKAIHYPVHERVQTVWMPGEKQFTTQFMKERVETVRMPGGKQFTTQFMKESRLCGCLEKSNSLPGSWKSRDCVDCVKGCANFWLEQEPISM